MKRAILYRIENAETGETYIGITQYSVADRWRRHVYTAMTAPKSRLHQAIVRHGVNAFTVQPVATCLRLSDAYRAEQECIQNWRPTYNQTNGGQFTVGKSLTPEVIEKIRRANIGKKRTAEQKSAMSALKKKQYADRALLRASIHKNLEIARNSMDREKQRAAVSKSSKNRIWTEESRQKLSQSCMGRKYSIDVIERGAAKHRKPVECVTLGKVYGSILEAAEKTGVNFSNIARACKGERKTAGGMHFKYVS